MRNYTVTRNSIKEKRESPTQLNHGSSRAKTLTDQYVKYKDGKVLFDLQQMKQPQEEYTQTRRDDGATDDGVPGEAKVGAMEQVTRSRRAVNPDFSMETWKVLDEGMNWPS